MGATGAIASDLWTTTPGVDSEPASSDRHR